MSEIVHIKEIKSLKIHTIYENGNISFVPEIYNLLLPHLHENFRNKPDDNYVAVSCFPPFPQSEEVGENFCTYIKENIKNTETKIIFDNAYEGHTLSCIDGIYYIINKLNLNPSVCYFVSAGMQAKQLYKKYCLSKNIPESLNIIILNAWERHIQLTMFRTHDLANQFKFIIENKEKLFLCFNRVIRPHRIALLGLLYDKNLIDNSFYSFFPNLTHIGNMDPLPMVHGVLSVDVEQIVINNFEKNEKKFPLLLNNSDGSNTNKIYDSDCYLYRNSYFSLVTETFFFDTSTDPRWEERSVFFSEKIFKPIACNHPFILVSRPYSLQNLRNIGYKTFHPFIDESYDLIENDEDRLLAIVNEVERLSKQTPEQWIEWLTNLKEIVEHNQKTLLNKSRDDFQYIER